jgi:hypothetical protein
MKSFKGIKYFIKQAQNGLMLYVPALNIEAPIDENFKESDLFSYL